MTLIPPIVPAAIPPDAAAVDGKTTESRPVTPVTVAVIGTGDGSHLPNDTVATTPGVNQPNLIVRVVAPMVAILVRFLNVYIGTVVGLLGAALTSNAIPAPDFGHLLLKCMSLAVAGAVVLSLKDLVTVFGRLEGKYPLATGSI